jgi:hypothetical protein
VVACVVRFDTPSTAIQIGLPIVIAVRVKEQQEPLLQRGSALQQRTLK